MNFEEEWKALAKSTEHIPDLVLAEMDIYLNDVPPYGKRWLMAQDYFPVVKLYSKNDKEGIMYDWVYEESLVLDDLK